MLAWVKGRGWDCLKYFIGSHVACFKTLIAAFTYNPSYSGGGNRENRGSRPVWAKC
jgi:hypothetical protein